MSKTTLTIVDDPKDRSRTYTLKIDRDDLIALPLDKSDRNYHALLERQGKMSDVLFYLADVVAKMEEVTDEQT